MSDLVFQFLLHGIVDRAIGAGETIEERHLAQRIGTPVTSIREAIMQLAALELVEAPAEGPVRLSSFTPAEALSEARAWASLHGLLLTDAWPRISGQLPHLLDIQKQYDHQVDTGRMADATVTNFEFFAHARALAENPSIRVGVTAAAYRLVLAEPLLPHHTDPKALNALHQAIIQSVETSNLSAAHEALTSWAKHGSEPRSA